MRLCRPSIGFDTGALHKVMYWGLPTAIWHIPHSFLELMHRGNAYSFFPNPPMPDQNE